MSWMLIFLYLILVAANVWDFKTLKIPNVLTIPTIGIGVVYSFFDHNWVGLFTSLLGIVIIFFVFMPARVFFGMGAGDIKLLMVLASFLGADIALNIGVTAIFVGAFMFTFIISPKRVKQMFHEFLCLIYYKIPLISEQAVEGVNTTVLRFSLPILISFALVMHVF
jgi:Flp pilus assembly protein protease CpaA